MTGETVTAQWHYSTFGSILESHDVVVGSGIELPNTSIFNDHKFDIDIGDDWVEFRFNATSNWTAASFNGWLFRDTFDALPTISNYYIESASAGVSNMGGVSCGWDDESFWCNFSGMQVAGGGEFVRLKVEMGGLHLSVSNFYAGQMATVHVTGATIGGQVGIAYSFAGPGPTTVNTGACGLMSVDLSMPIQVLGFYTASGGQVNVGVNIPPTVTGKQVWIQALDMTTCELSNGLAETVM